MYSAKEKLHHFRKLLSPHTAEADLTLLHIKAPQDEFTRFDLSPRKNAEDILFALLNVATHDEIVRNRREFQRKNETLKGEDDNTPTPQDETLKGEDDKAPTPQDETLMGEDNKAPAPQDDTLKGEDDKAPAPQDETLMGEDNKAPASQDEILMADGESKKQNSPKKKKKSTLK